MTSLVRRYPIHQYVVLGAGMAAFIATQWISDDGFIYLTYVDNLVRNGVGAVFNADEYVEGYTSVAWLGLLSIARAFSDLLGSSTSLRQLTLLLSHGLSLTALVVVLEINRSAVVRAVGNDKDRLNSENINLPLVFIVGTRAVHQFASSGLETPLVLVFSVLVARQLLTPSRGIVWPSILVGAGPLIRPDLALLSVVILVHAFFLVNRKTALLVAAAAIIPNLMVVTMRVWLYASILPNTYFAKTGIDNPLRHGIYYLYDVTYAYAIQWIALFAIVAVLLIFRREPQELVNRLFLLGGGAIYGGYVVAVGGDFMHGRFWLPVLVLLYVSLSGLGSSVLSALVPRGSPRGVSAARVGTVALLAAFLFYQRPLQDTLDPDDDAQFHGISNQVKAYYLENPNLHRWSAPNEHVWAKRGRRVAELSRKLDEEVGVVAGGVGQVAFHGKQNGAEVYVFDLLALTQPVVAHMDAGTGRRIGHKKRSPQVYTALNERVDFAGLYVEGYDETFRLPPPNEDLVLVNLELMYRLADAGLVSGRYVTRGEQFIERRLTGARVDVNFVYFLSRRFRGNPRLEALIRDTSAATRLQSDWELWHRTNASTIESLHRQVQNRRRFFENLDIALDNLVLPTIPYLDAAPHWVEMGEG